MQDRICRIDENLLHRAAGPYIRVKLTAVVLLGPARVINDRSGAREWSSIMARGGASDPDARAGRIWKCIAALADISFGEPGSMQSAL